MPCLYNTIFQLVHKKYLWAGNTEECRLSKASYSVRVTRPGYGREEGKLEKVTATLLIFGITESTYEV